MANIIPNTPIASSPAEVIRLYHLLKRLPDEVFIAQRLPSLHGLGPDFLLLVKNRALLICVSSATVKDVKASVQFSFFGGKREGEALDEPQIEAVAAFQSRLASIYPTAPAVPAVILFPNLTKKHLKKTRPAGGSIQWGPKDVLQPDLFAKWLSGHFSEPLPEETVKTLRRVFTPEVVVPQQFTVRQPVERNVTPGLADSLLDYDQERALKIDLTLPDLAKKAARDFNLQLVNGVAGSGKSLIIIYRAHMLRQLFPQKRILGLTHNRPLNNDLRRKFNILSGNDREVQFYTFMGWCWRHWPGSKDWQFVSFRERKNLATMLWHKHLEDTAVSEQMLLEEIDWFKDNLYFGLDDYLSSDRTGRGFALAESMRRRVFAAMEDYHKELHGRGLRDWGDVPRQVWRLIKEGKFVLPQYDVILIDEAQFFAPIWFEIVKLMLKPETGHLFLVADPTQGFLKRRRSWLSSGLDVRGRTHRLDKSYRTTRQILDFATLLYRTRLQEEDEDVVAPSFLDMPSGMTPIIIPLTSEQDEATRVVGEIRELVIRNTPMGHILVIHASYDGARLVQARLEQAFGQENVVDPGYSQEAERIRVCSLNSATGIESPIVFLMGVHGLYEMEQSVRLSEEERLELIRENTRKLYMAITRAGQRLVLTYVGEMPGLLQEMAGAGKRTEARVSP